MASARCAVFINRAPSVAVPIRRLSTTTIKNTRSTFHVTPAKFNLQQTKINNPLLLSSTKPLTFSRKFATSVKEYEEQITRHIQQNDFDAAEATFKTMREQKVNPSLPLLSSLIMEFSAAGKTDKSLEYYDVLRKLGYSPDEKILNIVVSSLSQKFKTSAKPKEAPAQPQQVVAPPKTENAVSQQIMDLQHTEQEEEVESTEIDGFEEEDLDLEGHLEEPINVNEEELTEHPIVIVHETGSNVFATATHRGRTLTSLSAGALGFKGSKRSTSVAAEALGRGVSQRLLERGYNSINIVLRTVPTSNSEGALKGLFANVQLPQSQKTGQLQVMNVAYHLCVAHNGCRPKKARRV